VCELLRQQLDDVREDRDRWRAENDKWRAQAEHLALAAPTLETKPPITRYPWEPPLEQAATFPPLK
jgi:hypothetical protein